MVKIVAHCLVRNEDRFIWYCLQSVLPYVDKIMVWDTNSTDDTIKIIKSIKSKKVLFKEVGEVNPETFTRVSQQMIEETDPSYDWLFILDGDEVWPSYAISQAVKYINSHPNLETVVVRTNNLVGDIYHRQAESAGGYQLAGRKGHLSLRFINLKKISGLHYARPHGQRGLFDNREKLIQLRSQDKVGFVDVYYHHATHLRRSQLVSNDAQVMKRKQKFKVELGERIPKEQVPEIFFSNHSEIVPQVSDPAPLLYWLQAALVTPLKIIRRLLLPLGHGY